jgi:hypothetical protein
MARKECAGLYWVVLGAYFFSERGVYRSAAAVAWSCGPLWGREVPPPSTKKTVTE